MMEYSLGEGVFENWILSEVNFTPETLGKAESIMYLGNGYMGLRSATEEPYLKETRNLFVNGTFNKAAENEVTELPNLADVTRIDIRVDGERFSLEFGKTKEYVRQLNLKKAELTRSFHWLSPKGKLLCFHFRRFVSLDNLHLIGMKMEVESITDPVEISFDTGINAQMSNSGLQHFLEGEKRVYKKRFIELLQTTNESNVDVAINTVHKIWLNGKESIKEPEMNVARRQLWLTNTYCLEPGDKIWLEKLTTVHTSRDKEFDKTDYKREQLRERSLNDLHMSLEKGYDKLFQLHQEAWQSKVWGEYDFEINSSIAFDQLALRFALYHLTVMTPAHDERMGIGAKTLSGEGYKGHSFWDTEIFILPFFTFSEPNVAKSLLKYRYYGLKGARKKARDNGYEGAMYPWESAWPSDGEVTPEWGDVDVITGEQTKIWSGFIEQHISADIAFGVYQYHQVTNDQEFMDKYGYEIIFDTASFWTSRVEWDEKTQRYHINDVIGPDEFKEHVNNNAYTNYMAYFNLKLAINYYETLSKENPLLFEKLVGKLDLTNAYQHWRSRAEKLYLPAQRQEDLVIPQDDTYLQLKAIDLSKYKKQRKPRTIYKDYSPEQINKLQVTKQADVAVLLYLMEQTFLYDDISFSDEVKRSNFHFYEPKTLHDSSLSLSTHAILANDIGESDLAYSLFRRAAEIDLGPIMDSSDDGVHAASIGGIWTSAIFGFAGVRLFEGKLRINPSLPKHWHSIRFKIYWKGQPISLSMTDSILYVKPEYGKKVTFEVYGKVYECTESIELPISKVEL